MILGLLHNEVFMPKDVINNCKRIICDIKEVELSYHLQQQCSDIDDYKHFLDIDKLMKLLFDLKDNFIEPFEVELSIDNDLTQITKICVRTHYDDERDVSIVFIPKMENGKVIAFIKTAWLNYNSDKHYTLDTSKYISKDTWERLLSKGI